MKDGDKGELKNPQIIKDETDKTNQKLKIIVRQVQLGMKNLPFVTTHFPPTLNIPRAAKFDKFNMKFQLDSKIVARAYPV